MQNAGINFKQVYKISILVFSVLSSFSHFSRQRTGYRHLHHLVGYVRGMANPV